MHFATPNNGGRGGRGGDVRSGRGGRGGRGSRGAAAACALPGFLVALQDSTIDETPTGLLGSGALGVVRRGTCRGSPAALKSLHLLRTDASIILDENERKFLVEKFMRECSFMQNFDHPNIVPFLGVVVDDTPQMEPLYLAMQYIPSGTLGDLIHKPHYRAMRTDDAGCLPLATQVLVLDGLFAALQYLAAQNLIHR